MFNEEKQQDFDIFFDLFLRATANVEEHYFQLPVAEREDPVYRERVYCYELYHRIREQMPGDYPYRLDGELDKMGHPLIQNSVGGVKPDFLVHERGMMNKNLLVMEVKPINVSRDGIKKDMETLCGFLAKAQYFRAIYLIYGDNGKPIDGTLSMIKEYMIEIPKESLFYFIQHKRSNTIADVIWTNR